MLEILNHKAAAEAKSIMKDKFPMMIEYFLEDAAMYMNCIDEGLAANDAEKVKSPAHTIKSSASQLGAEKMSEAAKKIEHMAGNISNGDAGDFEQLKKLFDELKAAFDEAQPELKKLIN